MKRIVWLLLPLLVVLGAGTPALAAQLDDPSFTISADSDTVGVGDTLELRVQAVSGIETPRQPNLSIGGGLKIERTMTGQTEVVTIANGAMVQRHGLTITWVLRATAPGAASVMPAVVVAGVRHSGKRVALQVLPAGAHPQTPASQPGARGSHQPAPQNPFGGLHGPFGGFDPFRDLFGAPDQQTPEAGPEPATDPKLSLPAAPAPHAFLRASVDKTSAVVGEQVLFAIDLYTDLGLGSDLDFTDVHEAVTADFVRRSLMVDDNRPEMVGMAKIGGGIWLVKRIRKAALFALEAGELPILPMTMTIVGRRGALRASEPFTLHVEEPPVAGRPPGYSVGDAGRFTLAAEVTPRRVRRGEAVSVTADLGGVGNLPDRITVPLRAGVEWLEPETHDKLGRVDPDRWGGSRTMTWVVRMLGEGQVELGELTLPYWDPQRRVYETARAPLGSIEVLAGTAPAASESRSLPGLPAARASLTRARVRGHTDDSPWFWGFLAAPALLFVSVAGARAAAKRLAERLAARRSSPAREAGRRVHAAEGACKGADARAADAAIVRALEYATLVRRGVNVRGSTRAVAEHDLARAGVAESVVAELLSILASSEAARFSPDASNIEHARERWKRARAVLGAL